MAKTDVAAFQEQLEKHFRQQAGDFEMNAQGIKVSPIPSSSNFSTRHFKVSDGKSALFVKVSADQDKQNRMRQWARHNIRLTGNFQAPRLVSWLELEGLGGLALEYLEGKKPDLSGESNLFAQAVDLLWKLHADEELGRALTPETCTRKFSDSLLQGFVNPLVSDMMETEEEWPKEVPEEDHALFHGEVEVLEQLAQGNPEFSGPADSPVHGNYRLENLLVTAQGWYVGDWDDLRLGDPALDFATLFWSLDETGLGGGTEGVSEVFKDQPELQERLKLYFRALLLQEAAGSLCDWVGVASWPEQAGAVQKAKLKRYQEAVAKYRQLYS